MPIQAPQWTEFLSCPVCCNTFDAETRGPVTLDCGHSICRACLTNLHRCPFHQSQIELDVSKIPLNGALVRLVGGVVHDEEVDNYLLPPSDVVYYCRANRCILDLALYLKPFHSGTVSVLSRPMQKKLVNLVNCQLLVGEGRARALRAARFLGERTVTELLLQHQNPQELSANLWSAVRARGCQFLGPAMQEEVLKLVLLALEDGSALSRKVLVMFVVQRLEPHYSQASKTSIGHVIQLLYRASCYKVSKREGDSSLMQLKEEFRNYEALRREHDAQIVQIATEAGLRIGQDQWSSLLYGDMTHKSHMQSIMDKLQTPQSFSQSIQELVMALQRSGDPGNLSHLRTHLELLASIDPSPESSPPSWEETVNVLEATRVVVNGLAEFISQHRNRRQQDWAHFNSRHKNFLTYRGQGPRMGYNYGHSEGDGEKYRGRYRKNHNPETAVDRDQKVVPTNIPASPSSSVYDREHFPPAAPPNIYLTVHNFNRVGNGIASDAGRVAPDKNINLHHPSNLSHLKYRKPDIILVPGATQIPEQEDFTSFESPMTNSYGPICRQNVRNVNFEEAIPCWMDSMRNANPAQPHWYGRPATPLTTAPETDSHYINQQPQRFLYYIN
ncbi:UNVERIFIED_CONTAM: hypothetical protein PYX00_001297 [Menopon gallinae]|uniref:RING-type E3 ubiquitin transferase n=1 Tax=Menopon gallinae TaxID=328185 RepID=A0AAW2ID21_9NEOP